MDKFLEQYEDLVVDKTKTKMKIIEDWFKGLSYGSREIRDPQEFIAWYTMKAQDPWWVMAIQDFPNGRRWQERYLRLMGLDPKGAQDGGL